MNRHGGSRRGSGRPRKWTFDDILTIGGACEVKWRSACQAAFEARLRSLPHAKEIRELHDAIDNIPLAERKAWLQSEEFEDHSDDVAALLHKRAGNELVGGVEVEGETYGGDYEGKAPRIISISRKPKRGTRQRIIAEVAIDFAIGESAVKNLWGAYRRFAREPLDP